MQAGTIRSILDIKGHDVWSIGPSSSVLEALTIMSEKNVGALIVMDGDQMVGILSERDYARKVILVGKTSRETLVDEIMSRKVHTIDPDQTIEQAMELINSKRIRHLPVEENGRIIGMVSVGDLVKAIILKQREKLINLEDVLISHWQH